MTTTRKNQFEEIIDVLMIEEVSGIDSEIKETLESLDTDKKRLAILSILDKDRDMFMKIKKMVTDNDVSKAEHIKNVVEMLRGFVEVGEREQKKFGEVFTKYSTINEMLDLIPSEDWSNPNLKFLDTCAGAGNFPAVLIERLMDGLKDWESDDELRYKHIVENMIHMVELQPKNAFLILTALDPQDIYELNIYNGSFLTDEFNEHSKNIWGLEHFDYIVQNPPYQKMDGGHAASSAPLYNEFIEKCIKISDKIISIHPSRWMTGGKGLNRFKESMFERNDIKVIKHFDDSQSVFGKSVDIRGGIQFFLIDKNYNGLTKYNGIECSLNEFDIFLEPKYHNIVKRFEEHENLGSICRSRSTYPIATNDNRLVDSKIDDNHILCYVSKQKGFKKYIDIKHITKNQNTISQFKVFTPRGAGKGNDGFGNIFIGNSNEVASDSYINFGMDSRKEAVSLVSYMNTVFANFFLSLRKKTQTVKPDTCKWIPLVPFDREWTDEKLFEYFDISEEEKKLILNK